MSMWYCTEIHILSRHATIKYTKILYSNKLICPSVEIHEHRHTHAHKHTHTQTNIHPNTSIYYFRVECYDHAVSVRNCAKRSIKHAYKNPV
jgi:allantoicase